ncbi:uncharacterized protein PODANS_6_8332 [Podospora anserina S mat+]|uniref:Podospora anserina S mat+ genomic DNA chromosome 6, supercontig 4 n=1 Tax=Podospora anserina (strain S / ATCC MYA-4624 / DSM 980 / FGSC 10383) TaxID=515849 RepID=B2AMX9_PODAN|nr:uncharacterized protein PODANS_6_8332 [Podospora anserina S mat+]CAP65320.1 unnamed protein product [Podospora anserina S mat+]CDP31316.1 Putative protein of unknown function [Podospora anserina S mat+]
MARNNGDNARALHRFYVHLAYNHWNGLVELSYNDEESTERWRTFKGQQQRAKEIYERVVPGSKGYERQQRCGRSEEPSVVSTDGDGDGGDGEEDDEDSGGFGFTPEISEEVFEKSLEDWDRELREGKEPHISYWLVQERINATEG